MVLHTLTTTKEYNNFLSQILSQKGEQQQESLVRITHDVSLFQIVDGRSFSVRIDVDVERTGTEGHSS